jgi:hypothetical protein
MDSETFQYVIRISRTDAIESLVYWEADTSDQTQERHQLNQLSNPDLARYYEMTLVLPSKVRVRIVPETRVKRAAFTKHLLEKRNPPDYCCMICGDLFLGESPGFLHAVHEHAEEDHDDFFFDRPEYNPLDIFIEIERCILEDIKFFRKVDEGKAPRFFLPASPSKAPVCPQARPL